MLDKIKCRTVFATHFHELTENVQDGSFCLAVGVLEKSNEIVFTHRINEEVCNKSFGIEVARLAGLPEELVLRAKSLLDSSFLERPNTMLAEKSSDFKRRDLSSEIAIEKLSRINTDQITPMQALLHLNEIKGIIKTDV